MNKRHHSWTSSDTLRVEAELLDSVLPLEGSYTVLNVALPCMSHPQQRLLSTLRISPEESAQVETDQGYRSMHAAPPPTVPEHLPPVLLLHGFAAGKAMWFRLLPYFRGANRGREIYAIDLPGMGANAFTREECRWLQKGLKSCATPEERAEYAARYYVDAVESWRAALKIEQVLLVGHSFGAPALSGFSTLDTGTDTCRRCLSRRTDGGTLCQSTPQQSVSGYPALSSWTGPTLHRA